MNLSANSNSSKICLFARCGQFLCVICTQIDLRDMLKLLLFDNSHSLHSCACDLSLSLSLSLSFTLKKPLNELGHSQGANKVYNKKKNFSTSPCFDHNFSQKIYFWHVFPLLNNYHNTLSLVHGVVPMHRTIQFDGK